MPENSINRWIEELKNGDDAAAQVIWEQYFERLVLQARKRLSGIPNRIADEEDIALSAFDSFCRGVREGRFPKLTDPEDLWKVLFVVVERKAIRQVNHVRRLKRGGGNVRGESVFEQTQEEQPRNFAAHVIDHQPTPDVALELVEQLRILLGNLHDKTLQTTAIMKMEAYSVEEIAQHLNCSARSVKRKLRMIRELWAEHAQGEPEITPNAD